MSYLERQRFKVRVGVVVFDGENRLLLVRQNKRPFWVLPGGTLEPEETLEHCAVREMKEETSLDISPPRFLYIADFFKGDDQHIIDVVFMASLLGGTLERETTENIDEVGFFTLNEVKAMQVKPDLVFDRVLACWTSGTWSEGQGYLGRYS